MDREEFFSNLPPEIILDILSRIPFKTVFTCKCVCKSWLELLETPEFSRSHLSKSVPRLLIHGATSTKSFKALEFVDSFEIERHELHYKTVLELDVEKDGSNLCYGSSTLLMCSANGLLFLQDTAVPVENYICNPMTREYIKLPEPEGSCRHPEVETYGFGVSRLSNQYKVVRIMQDRRRDPVGGLLSSIPKTDMQVYTLGTTSWRSINAPCEELSEYSFTFHGKLFNGNLYWVVTDLTNTCWILCFDLETEVFTKFGAPLAESEGYLMAIGILRDRLCLCDNSSEAEISIYVMNDNGDEKKFWNKEYVLSKIPDSDGVPRDAVYPLKAFVDGDILLWEPQDFCLICYSNRTKAMAYINLFDGDVHDYAEAILYVPSFISLKDFETQNVKVFEFVCCMI